MHLRELSPRSTLASYVASNSSGAMDQRNINVRVVPTTIKLPFHIPKKKSERLILLLFRPAVSYYVSMEAFDLFLHTYIMNYVHTFL